MRLSFPIPTIRILSLLIMTSNSWCKSFCTHYRNVAKNILVSLKTRPQDLINNAMVWYGNSYLLPARESSRNMTQKCSPFWYLYDSCIRNKQFNEPKPLGQSVSCNDVRMEAHTDKPMVCSRKTNMKFNHRGK